MNKEYWKMKNGQLIDIDKMDIDHLRNTLKMLVRAARSRKPITKRSFRLHGDIANDFNESQYDDNEYFEPLN